MHLSEQELEHLETLARLKVPEAEREKMRHDIGAILSYVSLLQKIDTEGVDPTFRGGASLPTLRADRVVEDADQSTRLADAAPDSSHGHIRVPAALSHKKSA